MQHVLQGWQPLCRSPQSDRRSKIRAMPPTPPDPASPRTAAEQVAELNAAIRALWIGPGGHPTVQLNAERRAEYERLCEQLRAVERGDVTTAA